MQRRVHHELVVEEATPTVSARLSFEDFYRSELPGLVALAHGLAGPRLAEELAQEAMLAAYRRWREVGDLEHPRAWVRRTCANLAVSAFDVGWSRRGRSRARGRPAH